MGRLTKTYEDGTYGAANDLPCGENSYAYKNALLERLGAYEDTGLNPEDMHKASPLEEWHEEYGDCLWWSFPIEEPPYCGTPLDCDFPDHVTHFTKFVIPQTDIRMINHIVDINKMVGKEKK